MYFLYLDEFGHNGPYHSKNHPKYNTHPAFGMAGIFLPERNIREFSHWFFNLKKEVFAQELAKSSKKPAHWEKKGNEYFRAGNVKDYQICRRTFIRLLDKVRQLEGGIIYHCEEKGRVDNPRKGVSENLYMRAVKKSIKNMDKYCRDMAKKSGTRPRDFFVLLDERSCKIPPSNFAGQMMYADDIYTIVEPPCMAESHMYQTLQAADWVCAVLGNIAHAAFEEEGRKQRECFQEYFIEHINKTTKVGTLKQFEKQSKGKTTTMSLAFEKAKSKNTKK